MKTKEYSHGLLSPSKTELCYPENISKQNEQKLKYVRTVNRFL